ncbi:MAG: hypothetical protein U9R48_08625, partial [Chloroflexota bacterium]|nr:hypothetical protein [Chloroflexota bacterium]
ALHPRPQWAANGHGQIDEEVQDYAVAQGKVAVNAEYAQGDDAQIVEQAHPTRRSGNGHYRAYLQNGQRCLFIAARP